MMRRLFILFILVPMPFLLASAQENVISGGWESTSILDKEGTFYSNNYLKLDYMRGRFSAGLQAEYYPNPLPGYDINLKGFGLPGKYIAWTDKKWSITAGDFYDQFGTGVILRSWEDRNLGWNNSIGGGRFTFDSSGGLFSLKVLGGFKRQYLKYASESVAGAEGKVKLGSFSFGGSTVARMGAASPEWSYSVMSDYHSARASIEAEWVGKKNGNAQTLALGFSGKRWSSTVTVRRFQDMLDDWGMNYLPSLCMEQSYMLACLNPYTTFAAGELGGSADFFYYIGKWNFHVNGSMIYALPSALKNYDVLRMAYRDLNIQVERRWSRKFKTVVFVSIQENSPSHGDRKATNAQNVFVLDARYKLSKKLSLRGQMQYLYSEELTKDWMAASLELSSTSGWGIHLSDMYNHGSTREHYYEAGVSWTRGGFKADVSYGHQRAGLVCSGGVCRWQPEYQGGMLRLSYNLSR